VNRESSIVDRQSSIENNDLRKVNWHYPFNLWPLAIHDWRL